MSLSGADAERLLAAGFMRREIEELANAKTSDGKDQPSIDLNNPTWQAAMESRRAWLDDKLTRNWTEEDIQREIMNYYERNSKRSPWDFIQAEGSLTDADIQRRGAKQVDYLDARRNAAIKQVQDIYKR